MPTAKKKTTRSKKTSKTRTKKGSKKTTGGGRSSINPKEQMRPAQIKILTELDKKYCKQDGLSAAEIRDKTSVCRTSQMLKTGKPGAVISLLDRKFVKVQMFEVEGRDVAYYAITPAGSKALKKALAE